MGIEQPREREIDAAHLIEVFGDDFLKRTFMAPMYAGEWGGTMALTEPDAGSSLGDLRTTATPTEAGHYLLRGSKTYISGGGQDITENIVHTAKLIVNASVFMLCIQ